MISEHISYAEGFKSQTAIRYGIDNTPPPEILEKMMVLASMIFEPVRDHFNKPIGIASFYRCQKLNTVIGGAENSQHMTGEAIDIDADIFSNGITNLQIFEFIRTRLDFDQLIAEIQKDDGNFEWIHVSYRDKINNRNNTLIGYMENGKMKYKKYA